MTLDWHAQFTQQCDIPSNTCTPIDDVVPVTLTFDPDTATVTPIGGGSDEAWWIDIDPLTVDVPLPRAPLPSVSGTYFYASWGDGQFWNTPSAGEVVETNTYEFFVPDSCMPVETCPASWGWEVGISNDRNGRLTSNPPTVADWVALLSGGGIYYYTFNALPGEEFGPVSYQGRIAAPEPPVVALLAIFAALASRRLRLGAAPTGAAASDRR